MNWYLVEKLFPYIRFNAITEQINLAGDSLSSVPIGWSCGWNRKRIKDGQPLKRRASKFLVSDKVV